MILEHFSQVLIKTRNILLNQVGKRKWRESRNQQVNCMEYLGDKAETAIEA